MTEVITKKSLNVPLNRSEGDLEIRVELEEDRVSNAWSSGVMFRGIERLMIKRGALDGLVITPRICGICGTAHLSAAAKALDSIYNATPPPNAVMVRYLALMTEHLQSDIRHAFLMFFSDFVNPAYSENPLYEEAMRRYAPFKGKMVVETIHQSKKVLEIIALLGGQWPHSSYMAPGGIATTPKPNDLMQCSYILKKYLTWYEEKILGCSLERWNQVQSQEDLETWRQEKKSHQNSEVGFYIRYAKSIGLHKMGQGHGNFISFGAYDLPNTDAGLLFPAGFARGAKAYPFDQNQVTEHVKHSWYEYYEGGKHPSEGVTVPYATGNESIQYSWVKAPRYENLPAETGPLAEMVIAGKPLFQDLVKTNGPNAFVRELARLVRPVELLPTMIKWFQDINSKDKFYVAPKPKPDGEGFGLVTASRGALGHWVKIEDNKIKKYQIITPTAWNGSPRDSDGVRGPWEEALIGTRIKDPDNPVELGHVVRSFDPCLVCAVHAIRGPQHLFTKRI